MTDTRAGGAVPSEFMMKSRTRPSIRYRMLLRGAFASLVAMGTAHAQTDAKPKARVVSIPASSAIDVPTIPYTRFVLPNGLVVIVHEDHSAPVVAIDLSYHVGSMDEVPGKRGLAHIFEHMMQEGSAHVEPGEHRRIIQESGGADGAWTWQDRTKFASRVPSNMLETVLWLEADRMAFLPARLDSTRFEREREQVINEYRQTFLGAPAVLNLGGEAMLAGLFPNDNPYHVSPIGDIGEVKTMTVADLRAFFDRYYVPNNAVLVVAGDVKTADMRPMVEKYFRGIPRKAAVNHPVAPKTNLTKETRLVLEDRAFNAQLLWFGWIGVPTNDPDRMALTALSGILSGSPNSRLQRVLIDDRKLAVFLPPSQNQHFDLQSSDGIFQIVVTAKLGDSMTELERVTDSVLAAVRDRGVEASELRRWRAAFIVGKDVSLQTPVEKAHILGEGQIYNGNPVVSLADIDAANRLTLAEIQRVARKYLVPGRVVMSVVPAGKLNMISKPNEPYVNVTPKAP